MDESPFFYFRKLFNTTFTVHVCNNLDNGVFSLELGQPVKPRIQIIQSNS